MNTFYDRGTPLIPAQHQPALLLDYFDSQEVDSDCLWPGSGLARAQLSDPGCRLTPAQYLVLLHNAHRSLKAPDTPFMLGQQALPGHFGAASHALLQAPDLRSALMLIAAHPARLSPLLAPHWVVERDHAVLYWTDACNAGAMRPFLVEMHMSAVASMCRWRAGERLPWRFCFNRTAPRHTEQHEAHLGSDLRFGCQIDAMLIAPDQLDRPWRAAGGPAASAPVRDRLHHLALHEDARHSLLGALYEHLVGALRAAPCLEEAAAHFGMSPATLKRRLQAHGTHFQAELDQVRVHVALQLFQCRGLSNEEVAQQLGFNDVANFRRSFKRWTGLPPSLLRQSFNALAPA